MQIEVLFCDPAIAVCVKPAGILSETGGMPELLHDKLGGEHYCIHRLDKAVGGVMVFARTKEAAAALSASFARRDVRKGYLAIVQEEPMEQSGTLRDLLFHDAANNKSYVVSRPRRGVKEASLDYELIDSATYGESLLSALRVTLHTGRSHQIRVQFASRAHPIVGDRKYGASLRDCPLALFSNELVFPHPQTGEEMCFSAPPPDVFPWGLFALK